MNRRWLNIPSKERYSHEIHLCNSVYLINWAKVWVWLNAFTSQFQLLHFPRRSHSYVGITNVFLFEQLYMIWSIYSWTIFIEPIFHKFENIHTFLAELQKPPPSIAAIRNVTFIVYRLITAYLLLRVNLDKIMHVRWDFDVSNAQTRRVSALDKHQNWNASALFCLNSRAQSKYAVVNLIHTRRKQTFVSFMW